MAPLTPHHGGLAPLVWVKDAFDEASGGINAQGEGAVITRLHAHPVNIQR